MNIKNLINGKGKTDKNGATKKEKKTQEAQVLLTLWRGKMDERNAATRELRDQLAILEEPFLVCEAILEMKIEKLVSEIGTSVVSDGAKAQYRKEHIRTSWNNQNLVGYAAEHPEILQFRTTKTVAANVSIRLT